MYFLQCILTKIRRVSAMSPLQSSPIGTRCVAMNPLYNYIFHTAGYCTVHRCIYIFPFLCVFIPLPPVGAPVMYITRLPQDLTSFTPLVLFGLIDKLDIVHILHPCHLPFTLLCSVHYCTIRCTASIHFNTDCIWSSLWHSPWTRPELI